jgi:cation:H+ antiporter
MKMAWVEFIISAAILVFAAMKLAEYGDVIAIRTRLGGMFIGTLLLAGATSLPEFLTSINSIQQGVVDLAAGNFFGSNMFNMLMLAAIDMAYWRRRILRKVAMNHAVNGSMACMMITLTVFFIMANIPVKIGWVGLDSLIIIAAYFIAIHLIRKQNNIEDGEPTEIDEKSTPSLLKGLIGFAVATLVLILVSPLLVKSSKSIAEMTGLGTGFFGTAVVAIITSLPELITTISAVRIGAYDMAVGNLFGSNMFNMFALGITDIFDTQGRFLASIDSTFILAGLVGLLLTMMGLIGNIARLERKFLFVEFDALLIVTGYILGLLLLFARGFSL